MGWRHWTGLWTGDTGHTYELATLDRLMGWRHSTCCIGKAGGTGGPCAEVNTMPLKAVREQFIVNSVPMPAFAHSH